MRLATLPWYRSAACTQSAPKEIKTQTVKRLAAARNARRFLTFYPLRFLTEARGINRWTQFAEKVRSYGRRQAHAQEVHTQALDCLAAPLHLPAHKLERPPPDVPGKTPCHLQAIQSVLLLFPQVVGRLSGEWNPFRFQQASMLSKKEADATPRQRANHEQM